MIDYVPSKFSYSRDPKDAKYIDLAAESQAAFVVSNDNDLLDLMISTDDVAKQFRQRFRPVKIVAPSVFLVELENRRSKL